MATQLHTGRLPTDPGRPRISLAAALMAADRPALPIVDKVDWFIEVDARAWGMDGNDGAGDCAFADVDHEIKADQNVAGNPLVRSTADEVLAAYSAVTGYDPARPDTDQGAVMQRVREWWQKTGITLAGKPHRILLFAEVDHTNLLLLRYSVAEFGTVGLGINFPDSAMDQFNADEPWDVKPDEPKPTSGHAIALVGYDPDWWYVITWGKVQRVTTAFLVKYLDEAWIVLTEDQVNARTGTDSQHRTMFELGQQFAQLTGKTNPVPGSGPAPTPAPTPDPGAASFPGASPQVSARVAAAAARAKVSVTVWLERHFTQYFRI